VDQVQAAQTLCGGVSLYLSLVPHTETVAEQAYQEVLACKWQPFARASWLRLARGADDPQTAAVIEELQQITARRACLRLVGPQGSNQEAWQKQIAELAYRRDEREAELAPGSEAFRRWQALARATPAEVQAALPPDTVLLDFVEYRRYAARRQGERGRYDHAMAAFVVARDRPVALVDLGPLELIAAAVARWHQALAGDGDETAAAAEVRRLVWQPLEAHLGGARAVWVSPGATLARCPLAALPGRAGRGAGAPVAGNAAGRETGRRRDGIPAAGAGRGV
jgi:hypothetical protein